MSYLETSLESFADQVQCNRVDARVERCHGDAKIVEDKEGTRKKKHEDKENHTKEQKLGNEQSKKEGGVRDSSCIPQ